MNNQIAIEVMNQMLTLPNSLQYKVLNFVKSLKISSVKRGVSGKDLLKYAGFIPADDLQEMSDAIELDCERIDSCEG